MKLYHLTKDLTHNGMFYPRVPTNRAEIEDDVTPRICFSNSIEGALTAIPVPGSSFAELNESFGCVWKVFELDTDTIPSQSTINPKELYHDGKVLDAWLTGEHWVTQPIDLSQSAYYIMVNELEVDEIGIEERDLELESLGWILHENDIFTEDNYKKCIDLEGDTLMTGPHSFEDGEITINLAFHNVELSEKHTETLKTFCETEAGLEFLVDESFENDYTMMIENNDAFQKLCLFVGTQWHNWC